MEITTNLRKKFVTDCKLPIKIYEEPYFSYQMNLFDKHYDCLTKYKCFIDSLKNFHCLVTRIMAISPFLAIPSSI